MGAPAASYVRLVDDASNTGKKIRTQSIVVGSDTVHEYMFVETGPRNILGVYNFSTALYTVAASAQAGTTAAIAWLINPRNSNVVARLRNLKVTVTNAVATAIDHPTAPRIALQRVTHVGVPSGASLVGAKRKTTDPTSTCTLYTASTGLTVTLRELLWAALVPGVDFTTAGVFNMFHVEEWNPQCFSCANDDELIEIRPGEGLVIYQIDAGTTSDQRRALVTGRWDEIELIMKQDMEG